MPITVCTKGFVLQGGKGFYRIGGLRRAFLSWISEFPTRRISIAVNHLQPKPALNPETSKKE
jgi:hypothetical protein